MRPHRDPRRRPAGGPQTGLARALSKLGFCSRSQAWKLIEAGQVRVNGRIIHDPERRVSLTDQFAVDGAPVTAAARVYLMLNKPRGLVTTADDEQGRETVFECLRGRNLPFLSPVGRLDKASEGLLLFTNDSAWAARLTAPETKLEKTYHVQVDCLADPALRQRLETGITVDGDFLSARRVSPLRQGEKNSWLEIVLDEGKNRHIRRLLEACGVGVLRLIRIAIGPLPLGTLAKGQTRFLTAAEVRMLAGSGGTSSIPRTGGRGNLLEDRGRD